MTRNVGENEGYENQSSHFPIDFERLGRVG